MPECVVCGGTEFYTEAGFYFCNECQTQSQDIREEVLDVKFDTTTRLKKTRIRQDKSSESEQKLGWTTWEQYNFILVGLTNELVELGASPAINLTVLQLWAYYLKKLEVAFTSTTERTVPKLSRNFNKRDAAIIYGKIAQRKRERRKSTGSGTSASSVTSGLLSEGSSNRDINKQKKRFVEAEYERFVQSQDSSEGEALSVMNQSLYSVQSSAGRSSTQTDDNIRFNEGAKKESAKVRVLSMKLPRLQRLKYRNKHVTTQYKIGPQVITPMKLWGLLYLALRIHDDPIHLADMLRYGREGHLSYYRLDHLLPPEVILTKSETNLLHQTKEITHKGMRRAIASLAKFLDVWETREPDWAMLLERYCTELQLPRGVMTYAERMMAAAPPRMIFNAKTACFPNYEGRVMAFIIVVMKVLFGIDGITEYEISRVIEKINSIAKSKDLLDARLFSFREWQRYIECRRAVIANYHFPTKLKFEPDAPGNHHLYLKFIADVKSKSSDREEPEIKSYKHLLPRDLADAMKSCVEKMNDIAITTPVEVDFFPASVTPQRSYVQQLLDDPEKDLPNELKDNFYASKVGYMTVPESLQMLAHQCGIDLEIKDCSLHFIEKIVRPFEQPNLPTISEYNKLVEVKKPIAAESQTPIPELDALDTLEAYLNPDDPPKMFVDYSKLENYDKVRKAWRRRRREFLSNYNDDFGFDDVLPNGKLAIGKKGGSDDGNEPEIVIDDDSSQNDNDEADIVDILSKYKVNLSNYEKKLLLDGEITNNESTTNFDERKKNISRDPATGKFVSSKSSPRGEKSKNASSKTNPNQLESQNEEIEAHELIELDSDCDFITEDDDVSILHEKTINSDPGETSGYHFMDQTSLDEVETLYRPYNDYWMYRCNFGRVKQKNFRQFANDLPESFQWLLTECANVVEMSEEDLYEEVCLVEAYHADVLRPNDCSESENYYYRPQYRTKSHCNNVKKKW